MKKLKDLDSKALYDRNKGLVDMANTLDELSIPFMLSDGVLLGAVRDGAFIPWDWDVELSIKVEDIFDKSGVLLESLKQNGFILDRINLKWDNYKVNAYKYDTKYSLIGFYEEGQYRLRSAWKYPKDFFDRLEKFEFLDRTYLVPSPPESYLEFQYGDWKTPIRDTVKRNYLTSNVYRENSILRRLILIIKSKIKDAKLKIKKKIKFLFIHTKNREIIFQKMYESCIVKNMNIIEIGSSDGREASSALKKYNDKINSLFIIEPDSSNLKLAKKNVLRYDKSKKARFVNAAIGESNEVNSFFLSSKASNLNSSINFSGNRTKKIKTKYYKLDYFIEQNSIKSPMLIKMDIEGYEVELLNSVINYLIKNNDTYILMEIHPTHYSKNRSMSKLLETLFSNGYSPMLIESAGIPIPKKFSENNMSPILTSETRGLYLNPTKNFVKSVVSTNIHDYITKYYLTPKIARSLLISNSSRKLNITDALR